MKVLFATYPMAFHRPGGGEVQLLAYARHLPAHGVEVTLLDPWRPQFLEHDLVHFFSVVGGSWHLCNYVKTLGLPLVITSSLWVTERTSPNFPLGEIRDQLSLADRIVTNSELESTTLSRLLDIERAKFVAVPNAVDSRFFNSADPQVFRKHFGIEGEFALCVANIEPRKNQLVLIQAMADQAMPLLLIGHVRDWVYHEAVLAAGGNKVRYLGALPPDSGLLASAYAACRLFILPSLLETPGLAALEAAAQGAPIVITSEGSTKEYFGATATYVDPHSTASIAGGISAVLASSTRTTWRPVGWDQAAVALASCYRDVMRLKAGSDAGR